MSDFGNGLRGLGGKGHVRIVSGVRDIDAILRGANPGEIPFYQVTRLIQSINLRTAGSLGLPIPPSILARADEVIE